jgi:hypothetical protein
VKEKMFRKTFILNFNKTALSIKKKKTGGFGSRWRFSNDVRRAAHENA